MEKRMLNLELPARLRVARTTLSPAELEDARAAGRIHARPLSAIELVVGGAVVATGSVVEEEGRACFRVEEVK